MLYKTTLIPDTLKEAIARKGAEAIVADEGTMRVHVANKLMEIINEVLGSEPGLSAAHSPRAWEEGNAMLGIKDELCPACGHSLKGMYGKCAALGCDCEASRPIGNSERREARSIEEKCTVPGCTRPRGHEDYCNGERFIRLRNRNV